jgi:hypothetical protein
MPKTSPSIRKMLNFYPRLARESNCPSHHLPDRASTVISQVVSLVQRDPSPFGADAQMPSP